MPALGSAASVWKFHLQNGAQLGAAVHKTAALLDGQIAPLAVLMVKGVICAHVPKKVLP